MLQIATAVSHMCKYSCLLCNGILEQRLTNIWSENNIQTQLKGANRTRKYTPKYHVSYLQRATVIPMGCVKELNIEHNMISDKRKQTVSEWDYFDAMETVLGHKPSTQTAVVVDTLENSQVQDTEDDKLQQPEDNSDTPVLLMPLMM